MIEIKNVTFFQGTKYSRHFYTCKMFQSILDCIVEDSVSY